MFADELLAFREATDNMLFMHEITWLLMQLKALIIPNICMLSYFKYIYIIFVLFHVMI